VATHGLRRSPILADFQNTLANPCFAWSRYVGVSLLALNVKARTKEHVQISNKITVNKLVKSKRADCTVHGKRCITEVAVTAAQDQFPSHPPARPPALAPFCN